MSAGIVFFHLISIVSQILVKEFANDITFIDALCYLVTLYKSIWHKNIFEA